MEIKEKVVEKILLLIAFSSISILALIAIFIFGEGLPLIWKVGPKAFILGMGRAIGETMAMIMILGNAVKMPTSFLDSARTLTTNIGIEMGYASGDHRQALFATGIVLFFIIMILNFLAIFFSRRRAG